jgi:exodeoxyribonuclease V gamma subunit
VPEQDDWQRLQLHRIVDDVVREATIEGSVSHARLGLADMTALLADRLRGRPTRANFRTGHLTICTLVPMRSVPHRVVCLLGLDDGAFPRHTERDGDDLVLRDPRVGDQDARNEDRQLLLDALLAAIDHLVVTYSSRDERTNLPRPPAVPLGELIDVIDRTAVPPPGPGGGRARDHVLVHHPLQPFDARCFIPGELVRSGSWSYDPVNLAGARALSGARRPAEPFLRAPLPDADTSQVELVDLERFVSHPVRAFLRSRLGVSLGSWDTEIDDALPVELSGLEEWNVGERLLAARLAGADLETCIAAERARGHLPPGALADEVVEKVATGVDRLVAAADDRQPRSLDVNVRLPDGTVLVGTVAGVRGESLCRVTYSKVGAKQRLVAWVQLLALTAARPELAFDTSTIGRAPEGASRMARITASRVPPLASGTIERGSVALEQLERLVDLYRRAMREPVPLFCKTSAAWASAAREPGADPVEAAVREWREDRFAAEEMEAEHQLVFGGRRTFQSLLDEPPRPDECGPGWDEREASRFGRYAHRLWGPLLDRELLETK